MDRCLPARRKDTGYGRRFVLLLVVGALVLVAKPVCATSIVPITVPELFARADVIVHGIVVSSHVSEDPLGRPETITRIMPLEVLKGQVAGDLVLHQLGGELPDGRFFKLWGRPEYEAGHGVVVFAIARPEGDYQTAELVLGKFAVQQDERGQSFAVPALVADAPVQVTVMRRRPNGGPGNLEATGPDDTLAPRELDGFLRSLRRGNGGTPEVLAAPRGALTSRVHPEYLPQGGVLDWYYIGGLWRWNNGAAAVWTLDGVANVTGGGAAEATNATATWGAEQNSTINYTIGPGGVNPIHLNALSSPCGWSTCMAGSGVIGCGGPDGGGSNSWRGETYATITGGEVWLRAYCTPNLWDAITTQAVLTHELGHTLGLGHSDQGASSHDVCRSDEDAAQMRSISQHRTSLGTDDEDAVRWLYGDGGNSCNDTPHDFSGDGNADVLWRHTSGAVYLWQLDGTSHIGGGSLESVSTDQRIAGVGDFNGDGKADILWRQTSGCTYVWLMDGMSRVGESPLNCAGTDWTIVGMGDFNGDRKADILWRHTSGAVVVWFMNGTAISTVAPLTSVGTDWTVVGAGDFNNDAKADILWRHSSGAVAIWLMNGAIVATVGMPGAVGTDWTIVGVGDVNGDGNADVLWRHTSGLVYEWLLNGTSKIGEGSPGVAGTEWTIDGVGDFNGDGKADILWRHTSGTVYVWLLNGPSVIGTGSPGEAGTDWQVQ